MPVSQRVKPWLGAMNTPRIGRANFVPALENRSAARACVYTKSASLTIRTAEMPSGCAAATLRNDSGCRKRADGLQEVTLCPERPAGAPGAARPESDDQVRHAGEQRLSVRGRPAPIFGREAGPAIRVRVGDRHDPLPGAVGLPEQLQPGARIQTEGGARGAGEHVGIPRVVAGLRVLHRDEPDLVLAT